MSPSTVQLSSKRGTDARNSSKDGTSATGTTSLASSSGVHPGTIASAESTHDHLAPLLLP